MTPSTLKKRQGSKLDCRYTGMIFYIVVSVFSTDQKSGLLPHEVTSFLKIRHTFSAIELLLKNTRRNHEEIDKELGATCMYYVNWGQLT